LTPMDGSTSRDVRTVMPAETFAPLLPMVNPLIVIVNTDEGLMEAPDTVMTMAVTEVTLHTAERPKTLLAPAATVEVMGEAKKLGG
jgi:hypothetical protein